LKEGLGVALAVQLMLPVLQAFGGERSDVWILATSKPSQGLLGLRRADVCDGPRALTGEAKEFIIFEVGMLRQGKTLQCGDRLWYSQLLECQSYVFVPRVPRCASERDENVCVLFVQPGREDVV